MMGFTKKEMKGSSRPLHSMVVLLKLFCFLIMAVLTVSDGVFLKTVYHFKALDMGVYLFSNTHAILTVPSKKVIRVNVFVVNFKLHFKIGVWSQNHLVQKSTLQF